jgi:hypothetical protein
MKGSVSEKSQVSEDDKDLMAEDGMTFDESYSACNCTKKEEFCPINRTIVNEAYCGFTDR